MVTYEIRERVEMTKGNRMETTHIFQEPEYDHRMATIHYFEFVKRHPDRYLEFVKVETKETCLEFTKDR